MKDYDGTPIKTYKRWEYESSRYMHRSLNSVSDKPVVEYVKEIAGVEQLFDIGYIID